MRKLTDHIVNPANDKIEITVADEPGSGGANHRYEVSGFNLEGNLGVRGFENATMLPVIFQNGPIADAGVNGVTHEALLAILADRLRGFQSGPYASPDNASALLAIESAQQFLQKRTRERMARGVEGTHQV